MLRLMRQTIYLAAIVLIMSGCKIKVKNQDSASDSTSKKQSIAWLLAGDEYKAWAIESFMVNGEDQLKGLEPCQLDNIDFYYRNQVFESTEGNTLCKPGDPAILRRGKWSLNADSTAIEVKLGTDLFSLQLVEINEKRLHYRAETGKQVTEAVLVVSSKK
ncbi:MAG: hypothetical protein IPH20_00505 [Bacteroidales bacterium]|nr:hypothetical protein [Bacteroidales bacterium]